MKKILFLLVVGSIFCGCNFSKVKEEGEQYVSDNLVIDKISDHVYTHMSFFNSESFGKVACNGMIVLDDGQALVFDTPADNEASEELINWVKGSLKAEIKSVVATHFHDDCLGGLQAFHSHGVPSYANQRTIDLAKEQEIVLPQNSFEEFLELNVGDEKVNVEFLGEGHTRDNIIGYFPTEKIMFGGCLIKEINATKGNLEDANVEEWAKTVKKVKAKYPETSVVVPGHGKLGGAELLDYTISLFE
ncbi:subclass B1 metallo-beta-lactamase [Olivibacter sp. SDN3]|uniref:subclass B1 metallo-beta-lactamase n=1 Tax=Olivibacter sp. SDN3 TaxID=2764720 RepID=UPI00165101A9|nr:subclass B1 metallo-beta-lactamase [Olivibacter sp. SDN3]QNL49225.1 subclass B1 metallo-beta-lactamase [Olivibacter sp. SDN3]